MSQELPLRPFAASSQAGVRYREHAVAAASRSYKRERHLAKILPLAPRAIADTSMDGTAFIIVKLEASARGLAAAAKAGHWSYDANRHIAVLGALRAELALRAEGALRAEQARHAGLSPEGGDEAQKTPARK